MDTSEGGGALGNQDDTTKSDDDKAKGPSGPSDSGDTAPVGSTGAVPMSTLQLGSLGAFSAPPRLWCDRVDPVSSVVSPCVTKPVEVGGAEGQEAPPSSLTFPPATVEVAATVVSVGGVGQEARRSELPSPSAPTLGVPSLEAGCLWRGGRAGGRRIPSGQDAFGLGGRVRWSGRITTLPGSP